MDRDTAQNGPGRGEVHTVMSDEPYKGEGESGKYHVGGSTGQAPGHGEGMAEHTMDRVSDKAHDVMDRATDRAQQMKEQATDRAREMMDEAGRKVDEMGDRAKRMASQAGDRASDLLDRAEDEIEERTGLMSKAGDYPLAALGIAFGVGFLLAGSSDDESTAGRAKHRIRGALMSGVGAAVSSQLRSYVEQKGGIGGVMDSFSGGGAGNAPAGAASGA
ncbi:MAG TPA: hypothetical protein VFL93_09100 [Longimicrobiaceae bacterium]|nr:hypothetical protein [Longimicrobiaceae bacterium]